jgi:CelD/BcsL family acetyltransferase involved in cellulose biosynthesis
VPGDREVRLLGAGDVTPRVEEAWRDLAARAAEPNPCNEPDMLLPALRHLRHGDRVRLLSVWDGNRLDALLPVLPSRRWRRRVPVPALVSWSHDYQLLGTPLVDSAHPTEALGALLRSSWRARHGAVLLEIEDLGDGGPVAEALDRACTAIGGSAIRWESYDRAVLSREEGASPVGGSRLKRVRRARRALERAHGPVGQVDRAGDDEAVEHFLALEAAGWKGRAGTAMACRPTDAAFFRETCRRFAQHGRLEVRSLEVADGPVAMQVALRGGDGLFHFKVAYDERYGDFSPGVQLLVDYADGFLTDTAGFRDSCTAAGNVTESQVWPGRRRISTVVSPFASAPSRAVVALLATARDARGRTVASDS